MREQVQAIKKEAHAKTLAPRLQLFKTLLQEMRRSINNSRAAPPGADSPRGSDGPDSSPRLDSAPGLLDPYCPPRFLGLPGCPLCL